jgi:hypothetical protein
LEDNIKVILQEIGDEEVDWFISLRFCEHGNETSDSKQAGGFLGQLNEYQ